MTETKIELQTFFLDLDSSQIDVNFKNMYGKERLEGTEKSKLILPFPMGTPFPIAVTGP